MSDLTRRRFAVGLLVAAAVLCFAPLDAVGLRSPIAKPTFVLVDRWGDRASSADLRSLGPNAHEWAAIRSAGASVVNVDADSPEASHYAKQTANGIPVLITFDGDKLISATKVNSINDVAKVYKQITGKQLK